MKIGVIGAGNVGGTAGKAWAQRGFDVFFCSSDPASDKMRTLLKDSGPAAHAGHTAQAVEFGDVILLATPWDKTEEILKSAGDLSGKILIDATNPLKPDLSGLDLKGRASGGEAVAEWAKGARVVKSLNQIGAALMDAPVVENGAPLMFMAGDDDDAKSRVKPLIEQLGFYVDDCGPLSMARHLEHLAMIWINRAFSQQKGATFALVLSKARPPTHD